MGQIDLIENFEPLLKKLKDMDSYTLFIVGANGSGKTTLVKEIKKLYDNVGFYTTSGNIQFNDLNPFNSDEYREGLFSKMISNGESLYKEAFKILENDDIIILDESTSTLDFKNSSLLFESFIRSTATIKIFTTNDILCLKQLSQYTSEVYNVETNKMVDVNDYIDDMVSSTISELKELPFQQIPFDFYEGLKQGE